MPSAVSSSRLPVGSSASTTGASLASARATATRCCWPPESASTLRRASSGPMPTFSSSGSGESFVASDTFSAAVR